MIRGTGVPDDFLVETLRSRASLRSLLFKDIVAKAVHPQSLNPITVKIRIVPAHGTGSVIEIQVSNGRNEKKKLYALPDTIFKTNSGQIKASDLTEGHVLNPSGATVINTRVLFVQADFCRIVSTASVYIPLSGNYVLSSPDRA